MPLYKFGEDDLFVNTIETYPEYKFYIQSSSIYVDDTPTLPGSDSPNILGVPKGFISLYEYNVNRAGSPVSSTPLPGRSIYPFVVKDGYRNSFKKETRLNYQARNLHGNVITSSYYMSASISRYYYSTAVLEPSRKYLRPLKNSFKFYSCLSPHYQYNSELGNKASQNVNLITIPSIFYGSSIKKGTVRLRYYFTGSLIGELQDINEDGELIQVGPVGSTGSGSVAGVVLYNEGFVCLTGSWSLNPETIVYDASDTSKWLYFGYGANDTNSNPSATSLSSSFLLEYSGSTHTQTITMLAHAKYGSLNHSNNPTYYSGSENFQIATGSYTYIETPPAIKNITYSPFADEIPNFKKTVYISKIGIYDKEKNLIGIAKIATPVEKTEDNDYTFKLKLDI